MEKQKGKKANLSHFAHPKNPYKNGVGDLELLAQNDPDFAKIAKKNQETGKIVTDWSDRQYTKNLLRAVMKRDFNLDLKSPVGSLAPALTNKLNYLLWIKDLANLNKIPNEEIFGIDVGTGAAIYFAAIAARHFQWKMLGTEFNEDDLIIALENIETNNLGDFVKLVKTNSDQVFNLDQNDQTYFFSMCNPPFYDTEESIRDREEYKGESSGRTHEIFVHGGEVNFVSKMIEESREISKQVKIFSSLIGHKKNVSILKEKLSSNPEIKSIAVAELCQGRTMRWVLAWTYHSDIKLSIPTVRAEAKSEEKQKQPIVFQYSSNGNTNCLEVSKVLKDWLSSINVQVAKEGKTTENSSYLRLKTTKADWRGQRGKRRADEQGPSSKKPRMAMTPEELALLEDELPLKLDCQMYLKKDNNNIIFQFVFLSGELGKSGMAELVQCVKRQLNVVV